MLLRGAFAVLFTFGPLYILGTLALLAWKSPAVGQRLRGFILGALGLRVPSAELEGRALAAAAAAKQKNAA